MSLWSGIKRAFTLPKSANSLSDILSRQQFEQDVLRDIIGVGGLEAPLQAPRQDHGLVTTDELIPGVSVGWKLLDSFEQRERGIALKP